MGRRRKRFLQRLVGGPLDGQERWMWGDTTVYFFPTPQGEDFSAGLHGSVSNIPCHVYREMRRGIFRYDGVEAMTLEL